MQTDIASAVERAGVIGAGGGGFPTHIKLRSKVEIVIANGSECEPLLASDKTLMTQKPDAIIEGLKLAMKATGASKGIIAVKSHYKEIVEALKKELHNPPSPYPLPPVERAAVAPPPVAGDNRIELFLLDNYYPAGDEFMLVWEVTKKVIPEGGIPLHVGVLVNNVATLAQIADAANGKAVTERFVTITGDVKNLIVVNSPIGTTYKRLLELAGGTLSPEAVLLDGGPMMGKIVDNPEEGIAKTTSGIVALPKDHFVIRTKVRTLSQELKKSRSACCQCFRCTDMCPRNQIGHDIYPHMTMRTIDYNMPEPTAHITSSFLCSQCGMCEMVACDIMQLSPRRIYAEFKKGLIKRGVKSPHSHKVLRPRETFGRPSIDMVMKKTGLTLQKASYKGKAEVDLVRVPLARHTGEPALPLVKRGDRVGIGDVIARPKGMGAWCHASIRGMVSEVNEWWVEIRA